jgi:phage-related baseplate assembly protein
MNVYSPTIIDLARASAPNALETPVHETLVDQFVDRFVDFWEEQQTLDPDLPDYSAQQLRVDPGIIAGRAFSTLRLLDRFRVNDAIKSLLAAFAKEGDLDAFVARNNVERLLISPATQSSAAVYESDENLLNRYLLSFDGRSAGSRDRYLYEGHTALPVLPIGGLAVNGYRVHGRRGDVDIVASGPDGRALSDEEIALLRLKCLADHVVPEATAAILLRAQRHEYQVRQTIYVPSGPSPAVISSEAIKRVRAVTDKATIIGAKVVRDFLAGAANGVSVIDAVTHEPAADIIVDRYTVPVCTAIEINVEVV